MHKLKNRHTGEVITTPYMAEAEEYLKSGDYEMSENKYPYIGGSELTGCDYVVYSDDCFYNLDSRDFYKSINQENLKNIALEYLMNTYGKCESQEHADFICKLAENHGFELNKDYISGEYFYISTIKYGFSDSENFARDGARLISLPLPPKEKEMPETKPVYTKEMPETKPVYTKEMHERGEWPPVGSNVLLKYIDEFDSCASVPEWRDAIATILYLSDENLIVEIDGKERHFFECFKFKPLPTIEDELCKLVRGYYGGTSKAKDLANEILSKYNITPKDK